MLIDLDTEQWKYIHDVMTKSLNNNTEILSIDDKIMHNEIVRRIKSRLK